MKIPEQRFNLELDLVWEPVFILGFKMGKRANWTNVFKQVFPEDKVKWENAHYSRQWLTYDQGINL